MRQIIFIITTGTEAKLVYPVYQELTSRGMSVLNISTGALCCEDSAEQPEEVLEDYKMNYVTLSAFGKSNIANIIKYLNPSIVITGSDQEYIRRSFLYAADGLNIPTLLLQLGIHSNTQNTIKIATKRTAYRLKYHGLNILKKYKYLMKVVVATRRNPLFIVGMVIKDIWIAFTTDDANSRFGRRCVAVSCQWQKESTKVRGVPDDMIKITGNPLIKPATIDKREGELHARLDINSDYKIILFLTCAQVEHGRWTKLQRSVFINSTLDNIGSVIDDRTKVVIKIHPVEDITDYEKVVGGRDNVILCKDIPLASSVRDSDIVLVGGYSNAILETCMYCKPTLILNFFNEIEGVPYQDMGIAIDVRTPGGMAGWILKIFSQKDARDYMVSKSMQFCEVNKELVDGMATLRLSNLIMELGE